MSRPSHPQSHRFVVVFREEAREIPQAAGVWRGWIEKVPDPRALDMGEASAPRLGFSALTEVPDLMLRLMQVPTTTPNATADRRPNR